MTERQLQRSNDGSAACVLWVIGGGAGGDFTPRSGPKWIHGFGQLGAKPSSIIQRPELCSPGKTVSEACNRARC
jgi:hypothetical protein